MKKIVIWVVIILVLVGLGAWFYRDGQMSNNTDGPIKIGAILNLTGNFADTGENAKRGIDLAVGEVNQAGGVLGRPVEMVYEDNLGDNPKGGLSALYNLINRDVRLIIGPDFTPTATVLAPVAEKANVVIISPSVGSEKFAEMSPRTFDVFPPNKFDSFTLAEYLYKQRGFRKIAIFGSQQEWEMDQANFVKKKFEELGGAVVSIQLPTVDNKDLRTEATKIKTSNPEAVVFTNYGQTAVSAQRLRDLGMTIPFFSVLLFQPTIDQAQGSLEGTIFVSTDTVDSAFNKKFQSKYQREVGFPANQAYDAFNLYIKAISDVGSTDPELVAKSLSNIKEFVGASGTMTFDDDGNAHKPVLFFKVEKNRIIPLK